MWRHELGKRRSGGRVAWVAGTLALAAVLSVTGAGPAHAFVIVGSGPNFPTSATVGETFGASFAVQNFSTPPESTMFPVLTISEIYLVPSCQNTAADCAGGIETGVFHLSPTGSGSGPGSCNGTWTIGQSSPGRFQLTPPGGEASLLLATGEICTVTFTATVLRVPTLDTSVLPGIQTNQVGGVTAGAPGMNPSIRNTGTDQTTVHPGPATRIGVYRPASSTWFFLGSPSVAWGVSGDVSAYADYNGDGSDDVAVFRPSTGVWLVQGGASVAWGTSGDIPVPADYTGDGTDDIAVFRPSSGTWFVQGGVTAAWGASGDIPVPGDYTGDGADDIAVFRPSSGTWFVRGGVTAAWGTTGDIPVPGDYTGDGTDDIAVFRPSSGTWFIRNAFNFNWGTSGDIPVPGDYNATGHDALAVFRPSTGTWFVQAGPTVAWGVSSDRPLPLPHAIQAAFFP